ncbi:MAG: hypothetical protein DRR16_24640 [Candidatus Parabeggiatoa sp. nov. 3]|nr:MAG: hypothetical protein DRR00_24640 [Gammaproteobacteria bacterium]RKZ80024.1 MAG: hypothetical protein DRR16_24640 [Gammaproteobacteria bacterium]
MQENITYYDTKKHHIHIDMIVINPKGIIYNVAGILDTGAPRTEFSVRTRFWYTADLLKLKVNKSS